MPKKWYQEDCEDVGEETALWAFVRQPGADPEWGEASVLKPDNWDHGFPCAKQSQY